MDTKPVDESGPACCRCQWWEATSSIIGKCKRLPPAAHFESGHYWPLTGRADWCGEFRFDAPTVADEVAR